MLMNLQLNTFLVTPLSEATLLLSLFYIVLMPPRGGGGTWVNFCWLCTAGLSEPLPHYSLFCGQL